MAWKADRHAVHRYLALHDGPADPTPQLAVDPGAAARDDGEAPTTFARQKFLKVNLNTIFPGNDLFALSVSNPTPAAGIREGSGFTPGAAFRNIGLAGAGRYAEMDLLNREVLARLTGGGKELS